MKISERNNPFRKKVAGIAVTSFLLSMLLQAVSLIPVMMMPAVVDTYIPAGETGKVVCSILAFCGIPVLVTFGHNWYQYYLMLQSRRLIARVNLECFDKLIHQPMAFFDENHSAELAKKASADIVSYIAVWTIDLPKLISNAVSGVLVFLLLCRVHVLIALFQVLYIPVSLVLMKLVGNRLQRLIAKVVDFNAAYQKQMQEAFRSIRLVKAQVTEEQEDRKVEDIQKGMLKIWGRVAFFDNFVGGISHTLMPGFFHGATFIIAALLAALQVISIGYMTAAVGYASRIHDIFTNLISTYNGYKKARGQVSAIQGYLELEDERDNAGTGRWRFEREIVFDDVTFRYPSAEKDILQHKNFRIKKGDWVGITGPSGIGKSTILELLLRFYEPDGGRILADGQPMEEINLYELRRAVSYVPQEPVLRQGTIRDNLLSARPDATQEELLCAAERTGILAAIEGGLDREVGEQGMALSGGERQRIAIARCLLDGRKLILLDEATSQMDAAAQDTMARVLRQEQKARGATVLSVAHRTEFNRFADETIRVE
ncbi:MAG: ABC transporter ATP-binding protein [Lachnospiraceae bacterium]|jgi:ABC-type multidrug transport system fused ATPase/permease subunit|nr:ABC transporter ATP-binding protein [Lachnospiraceae bacterium]